MPKFIHVAAAVICNENGDILIARRPATVDQGGLWEFPGGKLAPYETARQALARELNEEIGIQVTSASPLIAINHQYPEYNVLLDVWRVHSFDGEAYGREGQAVRWVKPEDLKKYSFPEANHSILKAISIPDYYVITGAAENEEEWLLKLTRALDAGAELVQMRVPSLDKNEFLSRAKKALALTSESGAKLILNSAADLLGQIDADGIHLSSERLSHYSQRPIPRDKLLSCACHNLAQLEQAIALQADLITLSPVQATDSHPGVEPMGWQRFKELIEQVPVPVYALGGMGREDIRKAKGLGGQGVAGIGAFWQQVSRSGK